MRRALVIALFGVAGCDISRTVDRSGLSSFKVNIVCAGRDARDCPAAPAAPGACPAISSKPDLGSPVTSIDRTQLFYLVDVTAFDGTGTVKADYSGTENVYIQFEGSVTPTRAVGTPPLATVDVANGHGCLALTLPPAFNQTNIWVEEPTTFIVDAGHRWPQGSFTAASSETIFRPAPLISDVAFTTDPVQETSALNNKHVIIDRGARNQPIVVTYVSANYFTVTDLGADDPDHAWGSLEVYTFQQPFGVKVGTQVSNLNGSVQNFLGLPELNFPVWTVERYEPDPVRAPLPTPHRLHFLDIPQIIPNMAAYKSGLVEIKSDTNETWVICALRGSALTSFYKYGEWIVTTTHGSCSNVNQTFDVVTTSGVPDFDPVANAGKKICHMTGILSLVVPTAHINLWTITPRNLDDFPIAGNVVDMTTPCPP